MYKRIPVPGGTSGYKDEPAVSPESAAVPSGPAGVFDAQTYPFINPAPTENNPAPPGPREVGNIITAASAGAPQPQPQPYQQPPQQQQQPARNNAPAPAAVQSPPLKKVSSSLRVFLEGQARHERLSREIDRKYGNKNPDKE